MAAIVVDPLKTVTLHVRIPRLLGLRVTLATWCFWLGATVAGCAGIEVELVDRLPADPA